MNLHSVNFILQICCVALLVLAGILLARFARRGLNTWTGISFVASVICYLVLDTEIINANKFLFLITVTASTSIPVIFFLLTKAIFDDHFTTSWRIAFWFALIIASHFWIYLGNLVSISEWPLQIGYVAAEVVSIGFVLASLYTAIKTRGNDLIESRRRFRNTFIVVTALLIGITLIVESMPIARQFVDVLQIVQRTSILGLTGYFLVSTFEIKTGFFFRDIIKERQPVVVNTNLRMRLEEIMDQRKAYRTEGLTIGKLAEMLGEQEYRVRRVINGDMGFRNFNDFLNKYRVVEACQILTDSSQDRKTILEIAYSLGYQSIGPFNKAFKDLKQTTPTAFRKAARV